MTFEASRTESSVTELLANSYNCEINKWKYTECEQMLW